MGGVTQAQSSEVHYEVLPIPVSVRYLQRTKVNSIGHEETVLIRLSCLLKSFCKFGCVGDPQYTLHDTVFV